MAAIAKIAILSIFIVVLSCPAYAVDYYVAVEPGDSDPANSWYSESYTSLSAAWAAVPANLVAGSTRYFIHIIGDWSGVTDVIPVAITPKTTNANFYPDISCPATADVRGGVTQSARHSG
jgi:hypothetical protein